MCVFSFSDFHVIGLHRKSWEILCKWQGLLTISLELCVDPVEKPVESVNNSMNNSKKEK